MLLFSYIKPVERDNLSIRRRTTINYLSNSELLFEINKSKKTYSYFIDDNYSDYTIIVNDLSDITEELIEKAKTIKANQLNSKKQRSLILSGADKKTIETTMINEKVLPAHITKDDIVFRVMTYDHIPEEVKENKKTLLNRIHFPPFKHYAYVDDEIKEVGRSHWMGGLENGYFSANHGKVSMVLSKSLIKLVDRYGTKASFAGYCVDENTEALTQRGWLRYDQIQVNKDKILSLDIDTNRLVWSPVNDMYIGDYNGNMFHLTGSTLDALVTPGHKFLDSNGALLPVENFTMRDKIVTMGDYVSDTFEKVHSDEFVELVGWYVTEGSLREYTRKQDGGTSYYATIWQSQKVNSEKCDRIIKCIEYMTIKDAKKYKPRKINENGGTGFTVPYYVSEKLVEVAPNKILTMDFILSLTSDQRNLLIKTMMDGDGSGTQYIQKDKAHVDAFIALCTLSGLTTNTTYVENYKTGFGVRTFYRVTLSNKKTSKMEKVNLHGSRRQSKGPGSWSELQPKTPYNGKVWCPSTDYGTFVCRRGSKIYVTGNSYLEDMKGQALLQLAIVAIQFDESKSDNPFAWYTTTVRTSFLKILKSEKKQRTIRDELMQEEIGMSSHAYQMENESD